MTTRKRKNSGSKKGEKRKGQKTKIVKGFFFDQNFKLLNYCKKKFLVDRQQSN